MEWFERQDPPDVDGVDFAYALWTRRGRYPAWRYRLHRATQHDGFRRVRREVSAARRVLRAHRRERAVTRPGHSGNVGAKLAGDRVPGCGRGTRLTWPSQQGERAATTPRGPVRSTGW